MGVVIPTNLVSVIVLIVIEKMYLKPNSHKLDRLDPWQNKKRNCMDSLEKRSHWKSAYGKVKDKWKRR